jgi:hypothetical protein
MLSLSIGKIAINSIVRFAPFNYISALVSALRLLEKTAQRLRIPRIDVRVFAKGF